jgi:glycosyltransferase involved in cell wall biosynthesis
MVNPDDVAAAMERYVGDDALRAHHAKAGRETCAAYTWESVTAVLVKRLQALREEDD